MKLDEARSIERLTFEPIRQDDLIIHPNCTGPTASLVTWTEDGMRDQA
jgi:hypothetical protein